MIKVAIFGAGAIGCYVGGMLQSDGCWVTFIGRKGLGGVLAETGLLLSDYRGDERRIEADALHWETRPSAIKKADIIVVCVKSAGTETAARQIAQYARPDASVVSLQNGIDNDRILRSHLPDNAVTGGMVAFNVVSTAPGRFHRSTAGKIMIESGPGVAGLVEALERAGLEAEETSDIEGIKWGKLLLNLNNGLNLISGVPLVKQLSDRSHRLVLAAAMGETLGVLKKAGIRPATVGNVKPGQAAFVLKFPDWLFKIAAARLLAMDETARSSMWDDLEKGREPEVEHLNGAVAALGRRHNVPTPVNDAIVDLVLQAFQEGQSPNLSGRELQRQFGV